MSHYCETCLNSDFINEIISNIKNSNEFKILSEATPITEHEKITSLANVNSYLTNLLENLTPEKLTVRQKEITSNYHKQNFMQNDMNMHIIYQNSYKTLQNPNPVIKNIFENIEKIFHSAMNRDIIDQISAIIQLQNILPNADKILEEINLNIKDLLDGKVILNKNFQITDSKNLTVDNPDFQKITETIQPLIDELKHIQLKFNVFTEHKTIAQSQPKI